MATKTADIVAAIVTKLTTAGLTARTSTDENWSFETMPVVVVDVGAERPEGVVGLGGYVYWNLDIKLVIADEGATPKLAPETTRQTAHAALYADRTLGGLAIDIRAGQVQRQIDDENPAAGIAQCEYTVLYRVGEATL